MKTRFRTLALGLLCLFVVGCATTKGKVADGVYYSPLNNFSVLLPDWPGLRVQDNNDNDLAIVSFLDQSDFGGDLWSITSLRLQANGEAVVNDPSKRDAAYRRFLTDFAMPSLFQRASPQTTIAHEEFLDEGDNRMYFSVVNLPEGHAALFDPKKGKKSDSVSGLLIFHKKGFIYMVRNEMKTIFNPNLNPSSLTSKELESSRKTLQRIKGTMRFIN